LILLPRVQSSLYTNRYTEYTLKMTCKHTQELTVLKKIRKVGNSFVITIPMDYINMHKLSQGDYLEMKIKDLHLRR